jgi:hypothetical protein
MTTSVVNTAVMKGKNSSFLYAIITDNDFVKRSQLFCSLVMKSMLTPVHTLSLEDVVSAAFWSEWSGN